MDEEYLTQSLVHLAREGKITNLGKHVCPFCAIKAVIYRIKEAVHA